MHPMFTLKHLPRWTASILTCLWYLAGLSFDTWAAAVKVSGTVEIGEFYIKDSPKFHNNPFELHIDGSRWAMKMHCGQNYYDLCGSDGKMTCTVHCFSDASYERNFGTNSRIAKHPAVVHHYQYPFQAEFAARIVWLAYASSTVFAQTNSPDLPNPMGNALNDPVASAVTIVGTEFLPGGSKLPSKLDFVITPDKILEDRGRAPFLQATFPRSEIVKLMNAVRRYENRPVCQYRVISTTNAHGATLPREFTFALLDVEDPSLHRVTMHGTTLQVSTDESTAFLPDLSKLHRGVWVQDYRFSSAEHDVDKLRYGITNGAWLPANDATLVALFKQELAAGPPAKGSLNWKVRGLFLAFALVACVPLFVLFRNKNPNRTDGVPTRH